MMTEDDDHLELYGDESIASYDHKIPMWLKISYVVLFIWGIFWFYYYWDGVTGWLDRGYWYQLEKAAGTTFER